MVNFVSICVTETTVVLLKWSPAAASSENAVSSVQLPTRRDFHLDVPVPESDVSYDYEKTSFAGLVKAHNRSPRDSLPFTIEHVDYLLADLTQGAGGIRCAGCVETADVAGPVLTIVFSCGCPARWKTPTRYWCSSSGFSSSATALVSFAWQVRAEGRGRREGELQ
jgi:hypothetical protein